MMPPAGYRVLAEQTKRLLNAQTADQRRTIRNRIVKLAIHFSCLTSDQQRRAAILCSPPSIFAVPETLALECLARIAEVRRG